MPTDFLHELFVQMRTQNTEQHSLIQQQLRDIQLDLKCLQKDHNKLKIKVMVMAAAAGTLASGAMSAAHAFLGG